MSIQPLGSSSALDQIYATAMRTVTPEASLPADITDTVEISEEAQQAYSATKSFTPESLKEIFFEDMGIELSGSPISSEAIASATRKLETSVSERVRRLLDGNGISTEPPVQLYVKQNGHIGVMGDHPDKAKIERLMDENPDLSNRFRQLSAQSSLLRAIEEASEFRKAYEIDQRAAVAKYSYLFDDNRLSKQFSFIIEPEESKIQFI